MNVYEFGQTDLPLASCDDGFSENGTLICELEPVRFLFNRQTLKYTLAIAWGYIDLPGDFFAGATPVVEIGTCYQV